MKSVNQNMELIFEERTSTFPIEYDFAVLQETIRVVFKVPSEIQKIFYIDDNQPCLVSNKIDYEEAIRFLHENQMPIKFYCSKDKKENKEMKFSEVNYSKVQSKKINNNNLKEEEKERAGEKDLKINDNNSNPNLNTNVNPNYNLNLLPTNQKNLLTPNKEQAKIDANTGLSKTEIPLKSNNNLNPLIFQEKCKSKFDIINEEDYFLNSSGKIESNYEKQKNSVFQEPSLGKLEMPMSNKNITQVPVQNNINNNIHKNLSYSDFHT